MFQVFSWQSCFGEKKIQDGPKKWTLIFFTLIMWVAINMWEKQILLIYSWTRVCRQLFLLTMLNIGPITNLKGPYFQPSLSVCLCVSDWHFYPSTLTDFDETWSQGPYSDLVRLRPCPDRRRGTARCLLENLKKNLKSHRIRISKFWSIIFCVCVSCVL